MTFFARRILILLLLFLSACGTSTPSPGPWVYRTVVPSQAATRAPTAAPAPLSTRGPAAGAPGGAYFPFIGNIKPQAAAPTAAPAAPAPEPSGTPAITRLTAFHRSGQTFLTWPERTDLTGEVYRIYRSNAPITTGNLSTARFLIQAGKYSARVWANYYHDQGIWGPRLTDRFIFNRGAAPLAKGVGALVWTLAAEDFDGQSSGTGYYAVTVTPPGGNGEIISTNYITGPVEESVGDPQPVEISYTPGIHPGPGGHFYLQYIDLRHWNPTFHTPNSTNGYYGFDPADPSLANALAYVYDYSVFEPTSELCGGKVPDTLPVLIFLHGWRDNRYPTPKNYLYPYCAYGVYPVDQTQTWYFGFARSHDYRKNDLVEAGDVIENFTEQRILRMLADLMRDPPGPAVDPQRVYLFGHSMGGTGALAFAERYPNVFAAIYSGQPVTNFRLNAGVSENWTNDVTPKWGAPGLNLPIAISAPNNWADHLQKYAGTGVYDWENLRGAFDPGGTPNRAADDMVPFGIDHGTIDDAVLFPTQGQPLYPLLHIAPRAWAGAVSQNQHQWSVFGWPLPNLGKRSDAPFWGFQAIRNETVPGLSLLSIDDPGPPTAPTTYNQTILWSASWNAWDGAPIDQPGRWQMSFCAVSPGGQKCGSGSAQTVDITPRRLQHFVVTPGKSYDWENRQVIDNHLAGSGTVVADDDGTITIHGVSVSPHGNRLNIFPH